MSGFPLRRGAACRNKQHQSHTNQRDAARLGNGGRRGRFLSMAKQPDEQLILRLYRVTLPAPFPNSSTAEAIS